MSWLRGINLDANGSFGLLPEVHEAIVELPWLGLNPTSIHSGGQWARARIEEARESVASLVGADGHYRVIFTSGATEANNTALACSRRHGCFGDVVTTAVEHASILVPLEQWEKQGVSVSRVYPQGNGMFSATDILAQCTERTVLVSVMLANSETGHIYPVRKIAELINQRHSPVIIHTDAVQAIGKIPVSIDELGVDMMSISGHKIGALCGIGALIVRKDFDPTPLLLGGPQESRWRAGTENVAGIHSFGIAARIAARDLSLRAERMEKSAQLFRGILERSVPEMEILSASHDGLPNTISIRIPGIAADDLVVALDLQGVYISSGAACGSGKPLPSHVILAMGRSEVEARESIRVSFTGNDSDENVIFAAHSFVSAVAKIQGR